MSEIDLGPVTVTLNMTPQSEGRPTNFRTTTFATVEQAASRAPFRVTVPAAILDGHELLDAALMTDPKAVLALTYVEKATGRHYIIVQSLLDPAAPGPKPVVRTVGEEMAVSSVGTSEAAVVVGDAPAGTPRPVSILWTKNDLLLQVSGVGYAPQDLEAIASSL